MGLTVNPMGLFVFVVELGIVCGSESTPGAGGRAGPDAGRAWARGGRTKGGTVLRPNPAIYGSGHVACFNCRLGETISIRGQSRCASAVGESRRASRRAITGREREAR